MVKGKQSGQRMIIISLDAVGSRDLEYLSSLPHFKRLREKSARCDHVRSVYPSVTYPAHTAIVTGQKPCHHGVVNNIQLQPNRSSPDWLWQRKYIRTTTLYDEAQKAGYVTAALLWPVAAKSRIRYNVPEIFANHRWQNQFMVSATNGPARYQLQLYKRFGQLIDGVKQPQLDHFVYASAAYTIRTYNPDLFLIHFTDVDTNRHLYGLDAPQVTEAMNRHDERLGGIVRALEETGDMDRTTIVVLGDHCQMDTHTIVYPNYYLQKAGLIRVKHGRITDYDFIAQHCDGSCYIYAGDAMRARLLCMTREERGEVMQQLRAALREIPKEMLRRIISRREAQERGADGRCICMLEANAGYYFQNEREVPYLSVEACQGGKMRATHGYLPDLPAYETFFMMSGYGVAEGECAEQMHLWDEGPTLAEILGVSLGKTDGKRMEQLLK